MFVLVSKILNHFKVNIVGAYYEIMRKTNEISNVNVHKMCFEKVDDLWFLKDRNHNEDHCVPSIGQEGGVIIVHVNNLKVIPINIDLYVL